MKPWFAVAAVAAVAVFCPAARSQQQPELKARELFYTPPPESTSASASGAPASGTASKTSATVTKSPAKKTEKSPVSADASSEHAIPTKEVASVKQSDVRGDLKQVASKQAGAAMPLGLRYNVLK